MNLNYDRDLERQITDALRARARTLPDMPEPNWPSLGRDAKRRHTRIVALGAAVVLVGCAGTVIALRPSGGRTDSVRTAAPAASAPADVTAPQGVAGSELPLSATSTADSQFLLKQLAKSDPSTAGDAYVVQPAGHAAVVINGGCMTIASAPTSAGYQGSCVSADQATSLAVEAPDSGPFVGPNTTWYVVWTQVPKGTAVVSFGYGGQHAWQQPVHGSAVFTYTGTGATSTADWAANAPVMSAIDQSGTKIADARIQQ